MTWITDKAQEASIQTSKKIKKVSSFDEEAIKNKIYGQHVNMSKICCLLYGEDGTAKSGIVQSYPLPKDKKMMIIDLDGGNIPLLMSYNQDKKEQIIVYDPTEVITTDEGKTEIDYQTTINNVLGAIEYVRRNYEKDKIEVLVIDGMSTLLKRAEYMMRVEKHLMPDQGVSMRYWVNRNKVFEEIVELSKSIPINKFYIAHEDFIMKADMASIKSKTNQAMFQKILCERIVTPEKVEYKATIDKSKYDVELEGQKFVVLTINKGNKEFKWEGQKVVEALM